MKMPCGFLLLLMVVGGTSAEECVTSEEAAASCSCTFSDMCCWQNTAGNGFNWTMSMMKPAHVSRSQLSATANNTIKNKTARLETSQICANGNVQYSLQFKYKFDSTRQSCQLLVHRISSDSLSLLWSTNENRFDWQWTFVNITSFSYCFKICFVVEKFDVAEWCKVSLDSVTFGYENISLSSTPSLPETQTLSAAALCSTTSTSWSSSSSSSPSPSPSPPPPSSSSSSPSPPPSSSSSPSSLPPPPQPPPPSSSSAASASASSSSSSSSRTPQTTTMSPVSGQTGEMKSDVPAGVIISVVIAVVVILVVCVVVIIFIRRRGKGQEGIASLILKKFGKPQNKSNGRVNSAFTGEDDITPVGNNSNTSSVPYGAVSNGRRQHETSPYEIADIPESSDYCSVSTDDDGTPAVRPTNKTHTQSPDYELAAVVESGGDYSTVDDADLEGMRARARPDEYAKVKKPKGGNYNKLSFQNPGFDGKAEDTYNHIQDEEPVYKVPRSDGNEYSLATNPGASSAGHSAGGGSEPHYVIVDGKGNDEAARGGDDEYNHLNLRNDPSANVPDSTDRGTGAGVYNHLDDQTQGPPGVQTEDTYNRVNYDGHTQDQNRKQNAGNYSHIGGF